MSAATPSRRARLTCPACGVVTETGMPNDACQFFWDCPACGTVLRPKPGDCCVFCSWADRACPPAQTGAAGSGC